MPRMLRGSRLLRGGLAMDLALLVVFLVLAYVFLVRRNYGSELESAINVSGGRSLDTSDGQLNRKSPGGAAPGQDVAPSVDGDSQHLIDARIKKMPDPRPLECKSLNYGAKTRVSVVVKFFDYEFFDLKMTLSSVLLNTDADRLQEIIVVDDGSSLDYIVSSAQMYLKSISKCRFLRNDVKVGVAGARMRGYREAAADVVVFLDTTVLVSRGWLEPLVDAIAKDPKSIAVPHYDRINNPVDYEYESTADNLVASMTWSLTVRMTEATDNKAEVTQAIKSPMLRGNAFAVRKAYLREVGGYDEGLKDGGGENLELALRTWMCGGSIQIVPCSRVGVLNLHDPVRIIAAGNFRRVAEMWLGESKSLAYRNAGVTSNLSEAEQAALDTRRESVQSSLTCRNIEWFFANIAGNLPTPSAKARNFGLMKCRTGRCARVEADFRIELGQCNPENINVPPAEMFFEFDEDGLLTSNGRCLTVKPTAYVLAEDCRPGEVQQRWEYKDNRVVNQWSHYCLMHVTDPDKETGGKRQIAMAQDCATASDPQFVEFDFITL